MSVINTHIFGRFLSVLCTITQRFGDPDGFSRLTNPGVHLCVYRRHSQFCSNLTSFMDYYSPFWGPEVISIVVEPQVVLTCWSSTIAVLADSGPFHGLLLTVLGSTPGAFTCRSSTLAVFVDSGLFRALLLTILGSKSDFHD